MKKVILGAIMFLAGTLSLAVLLGGTMANDWTINGQLSSFWTLSQYGLIPALYGFVAVAVIGFGIGVWGLFDKKDR